MQVALATGLALAAIAVVVVLTRSPPRVARTNSVPFERFLAFTETSGNACQGGEAIPGGTSAIRLPLAADLGPRVSVSVFSGKRLVTRGQRGAGWAGGVVTVHVTPLRRALSAATVCFSFTGANERVSIMGARTSTRLAATSSGGPLPGRLRIEYLQPGRSSWWSLALPVARRMGLGRAWAGAPIALLVLAVMAAVAALATWLTARELG